MLWICAANDPVLMERENNSAADIDVANCHSKSCICSLGGMMEFPEVVEGKQRSTIISILCSILVQNRSVCQHGDSSNAELECHRYWLAVKYT